MWQECLNVCLWLGVCKNIRVVLLRKGLDGWPVPAVNPAERQNGGGPDCD